MQIGLGLFVSEGGKTGGLGTKVPRRGPGQSHGRGLGAKIYMLKTIAIMC